MRGFPNYLFTLKPTWTAAGLFKVKSFWTGICLRETTKVATAVTMC